MQVFSWLSPILKSAKSIRAGFLKTSLNRFAQRRFARDQLNCCAAIALDVAQKIGPTRAAELIQASVRQSDCVSSIVAVPESRLCARLRTHFQKFRCPAIRRALSTARTRPRTETGAGIPVQPSAKPQRARSLLDPNPRKSRRHKHEMKIEFGQRFNPFFLSTY